MHVFGKGALVLLLSYNKLMVSLLQRVKEGRRTILSVGFAGFFGGIAQDIFLPVLPLYLTQVLGLDKAVVGLAEGFVTAASSVFKIVAGWLSDKFGRQKPIAETGYLLSLISRMALAAVSTPLAVIGLRAMDGIGKGVKDPPKDVLVANAAGKATRGRGFGIARMLDTFGSAIGPLILSGLLLWFTSSNFVPDQYYRWLMVAGALVLVVTIGILHFGIRESKNAVKTGPQTKVRLSRPFYLFVAVSGLFALANSSDAFLILRSQNLGLGIVAIPIAYAALNVVYGALSLPAGILSDKLGRIPVIAIGWAVFSVTYLGFAAATSAWQMWPLFICYGIFYAASEGVSRALIADVVGQQNRGKAYGAYNTVIGLVALPAGLIAGTLWDAFGPSSPFYFSAVVSLLAVGLLFLLRKSILKAA